MGIYIDMEMPENCALCPVWDAGNCLAASEAIICEYTKRPADCPLVPVPPHGRLIDADALCKTLRGLAENEYTPEVFANWIENHIDTIIPAEEEHE